MTPNRLPAIAFRWSISAVFTFWLILAGSSACHAQTSPPQNIALKKRACDSITKSDAESILGRPVVSRGDGVFDCSFVETGFTSEAPKNHQVSFSVWYWASPDPGQYAVMRKDIADHKNAAAVMKELTDFADAAIWTWTPGWGGSLDAFSGGTIQVQVTISGLPEADALRNAKALATRVLGKRTGYAYLRTPNSNASVSAPQKAAGAPQPLPKTVARAATAAPPSKATAAGSPPTATNGIVHEPKSYWYDYRSKIIQQVFDGDFGRDLDSSTQFHVLFNSYVESFSKSCHTYLPAQHEAVTLSQVTTKKDGHGNVVSQRQGDSWTVDVDSRFAPEYREYARSLLSTSGETLADALAIGSGRVSASAYFDPGTDITTFFAHETCGSAAMRQLTENLLRAAKGRSPLQDAGDPNVVRVCVPENLVENHSWKSPPAGGKMETFKNAVRKIIRAEAQSKGLENPLFKVVERPANGGVDLFDTFDPATTDPRRLVQFGGAGRDAHCTVGSYELTLPINP